MCCKTIFTTRMSNIDSRTSTSAQRRFKNTVHLDSIIARSQRSKEFCNTITLYADTSRTSPDVQEVPKPAVSRCSNMSCADGRVIRSPRRLARVASACSPLMAVGECPLPRRMLNRADLHDAADLRSAGVTAGKVRRPFPACLRPDICSVPKLREDALQSLGSPPSVQLLQIQENS